MRLPSAPAVRLVMAALVALTPLAPGASADAVAAARHGASARHPAPVTEAVPIAAAVVEAVPIAAPVAEAVPTAAAVPGCGDAKSTDFPLDAALQADPSDYARGGDWRVWRLQLRNTTERTCQSIHPVVVMAGRDRKLRPRHIRLEFHDKELTAGERRVRQARWRPVRFETTDQHESIGILEAPGFPGFTVPADRSIEVALRLRLTDDAPLGPVVAAVTTVQRRDRDGDWVGQSENHAFTVVAAARTEGGAGDGRAEGSTGDDARGEAEDRRESDGRREHHGRTENEGRPSAGSGAPAPPAPPALADTGPAPRRADRAALLALSGASAACLLAGAALLASARRLRVAAGGVRRTG
ncbi:hypothetical protein LRS74_21270 [Streptomyces sp. LX-29]|uniref:hypothetical protein n=1 Tax=Streptomyces sp. LX-29 TaxID=2900152 RepID=UPI00240D8EE2|nr:hypothetical protein [Streptomyces sp. LX-29]WFB09286.1 hypothetical protein LRS74_21270 [Streptomyces sp. LX-29]